MATDTLKEFRKLARKTSLPTWRAGIPAPNSFKLRTGEATEKVKDSSKFRKVKKDIARILTIRTQQETKKSPKAQA